MDKQQGLQPPHYTPLLAWVGGKRRLLKVLTAYLPKQYHHYYELFCGGSAMGLYLAPDQMTLNDANVELINFYRVMQNPVTFEQFKPIMIQHQQLDSKAYFLKLRALDQSPLFQTLSPVQRAARFLYIVQASFSNVYRVNQKGFCNIPYGHGRNLNLLKPAFVNTVKYLQTHDVNFTCGDYHQQLSAIQAGDLVYFDPPYVPFKVTSNFTSYTSHGFTLADQEALVKVVDQLTDRGVYVMISNSNTDLVHQLYHNYQIHDVDVFRPLVRDGDRFIKEVVITNY